MKVSRRFAIYFSWGCWLLPAAGWLGCSEAFRERLARFFFEIPDPAHPQADDSAKQAQALPESLLASSPPPVSRFVSVHRPYTLRQCSTCHDSATGVAPRADLLDACRRCHTAYFGDAVRHGPVAMGQCAQCHDMHRSEHTGLLKEPMPEMCIACHEELEDLSEEFHRGANAARCTLCHDPHFGAEEMLLKKPVEMLKDLID